MTKQVSIAGGALRLNETELSALQLVAARAPHLGDTVALRISEVCAATGVSAVASRRALRSLEERGLLTVEKRFAADGGQQANAYALTQLGALAAAAAPAQAAAAPEPEPATAALRPDERGSFGGG